MDEYIDTFKSAEPWHKFFYFLPVLLFITGVAFVLSLYLEMSGDFYGMFANKGIAYIFVILWGIESIALLCFVLLGLLAFRNDIFDLVTTKNLKELLFSSLVTPIFLVIYGILPMLFLGIIPFLILEYWEFSRFLLPVLLLLIIWWAFVSLVNQTSAKSSESTLLKKTEESRSPERSKVLEKSPIVHVFIYPVLMSTISGVLTYLITHSLFGFGTVEASIGSILAAIILGSLGYKA